MDSRTAISAYSPRSRRFSATFHCKMSYSIFIPARESARFARRSNGSAAYELVAHSASSWYINPTDCGKHLGAVATYGIHRILCTRLRGVAARPRAKR
jgi:hypothetical protein